MTQARRARWRVRYPAVIESRASGTDSDVAKITRVVGCMNESPAQFISSKGWGACAGHLLLPGLGLSHRVNNKGNPLTPHETFEIAAKPLCDKHSWGGGDDLRFPKCLLFFAAVETLLFI